jgi:DNA replication protein DnaC
MVEVGCAECDFTGFLVREEQGREFVSPCGCQRRERGAGDLVAAGVPRRYLHCSLSSYQPANTFQKQALAVARTFVESWPAHDRGILFTGSCGTGKTHLATAILRQLVLEQGIEGCFADYQDLLKRIQGTFGRQGSDGPTEDDLLGPVLTADLLVLDDLGSRRSTAWAEETLAHVLTVRYNEERTTILTTNLLDIDMHATPDSKEHLPGDSVPLSERINERTLSRIHEMCRVVHLEGPDHRRLRR